MEKRVYWIKDFCSPSSPPSLLFLPYLHFVLIPGSCSRGIISITLGRTRLAYNSKKSTSLSIYLGWYLPLDRSAIPTPTSFFHIKPSNFSILQIYSMGWFPNFARIVLVPLWELMQGKLLKTFFTISFGEVNAPACSLWNLTTVKCPSLLQSMQAAPRELVSVSHYINSALAWIDTTLSNKVIFPTDFGTLKCICGIPWRELVGGNACDSRWDWYLDYVTGCAHMGDFMAFRDSIRSFFRLSVIEYLSWAVPCIFPHIHGAFHDCARPEHWGPSEFTIFPLPVFQLEFRPYWQERTRLRPNSRSCKEVNSWELR